MPPRQGHHQPIDPDPDPPGGRHPVLERLNEGLIVGLGLLVAGAGERLLLLEAATLFVGIVELGERVGDLHPADVGLKALDEGRIGSVALGKR